MWDQVERRVADRRQGERRAVAREGADRRQGDRRMGMAGAGVLAAAMSVAAVSAEAQIYTRRNSNGTVEAYINPVVATMVYSSALRSITRRPSHSQAISISVTPIHSSTDDSTRPCPNRSQDTCSDSRSGSCSRVLPAPSPPAVINTAPIAPSSAGRACGDDVHQTDRNTL